MTDAAPDIREDWAGYLRHGWREHFDGSASPQFIGSLILAIVVGIVIGVSLGGASAPVQTIAPAQKLAEERSILHIEELSAKSAALEASLLR
jgi:hypothetical protein